ncbi:MAG TPA: sigma-54 dependent transcriptional regulator [Candidatus Saccharimonadales bacterium]|jgi:two-component system response regulator AtoC|nr:sigma-54 dependent transcriptional regulator [Candidatus Saccharimonadales bacterium]
MNATTMSSSSTAKLQRNILVVDDEPSMLNYTRTLLEVDNYHVETAAGGEEALQRLLKSPAFDLMLVDMAMPRMNGLQTIESCRKLRPAQRIVAFSCISDTNTVVQAIRLGAMDYMTKPFYKAELDALLQRCLIDQPVTPAGVQEHIESLENDLFFLAASPVMKQIRAQISLVAKVDVPVLLLGESGVGKEILARLVHKLSPRAHHPLLKVNCAALPADLLESELFGYEQGAFTGATRQKPGKFELCNKGTILLDEIGEMTPALQAKLLHVLQDGQFSRLGGRSNISADFRVLAATNIDVQKAIVDRSFREDLYYRLNAFTINIPPLRERREEIPLLFRHFMNQFSEKYAHPSIAYSEKMIQACMTYHWPGNLRELGNFVKRYMVLQDEALAISELSDKVRGQSLLPNAGDESGGNSDLGLKSLVRSLKDKTELKAIEEALIATTWNRKLAAARLNISYKALLYKMKQYQIIQPRAIEADVRARLRP